MADEPNLDFVYRAIWTRNIFPIWRAKKLGLTVPAQWIRFIEAEKRKKLNGFLFRTSRSILELHPFFEGDNIAPLGSDLEKEVGVLQLHTLGIAKVIALPKPWLATTMPSEHPSPVLRKRGKVIIRSRETTETKADGKTKVKEYYLNVEAKRETH
jgi:hypothetical protein